MSKPEGRTAEKALLAMERHCGGDERWDAVEEKEKLRMISEALEEATRKAEKAKEEARIAFRQQVLSALKGRDSFPPFSKIPS